jgi:hypothetical protein
MQPDHAMDPRTLRTALLQAMADAPTQADQRALGARLAALDAEQNSRHREQSALDSVLAGGDLSDGPARGGAQYHSMDSDWLGEVEPDAHDLGLVGQEMTAAASVWYSRHLDPEVKRHPAELSAQASGAADRAAGRFGSVYPAARAAFLQQVAHLHSRTGSEFQVPTGSSLPVGVHPDEAGVFDQVGDFEEEGRSYADGTSVTGTPSLAEGGRVEGDHAEGIDNGVTDSTHDRSGTPGTENAIDYLDGHAYPANTGTGMTSMSGLDALAWGAAPSVPTPAGPESCPGCGGYGHVGQGPVGPTCPECGGSGQVEPGDALEILRSGSRRTASSIDLLRQIATSGQMGPVDGQQVDTATAGAIVQAYDRAAPDQQAQMQSLPVDKLAGIAWKLMSGGQGGAAPVQAGRRATADAAMPSDRGSVAESLDEGGPVEGDHGRTGEPTATQTTHNSGPGNGPAVDYLNGSTYPWPGTAQLRPLREVAASLRVAEARAGYQLPAPARPFLAALETLTHTGQRFGEVSARQVVERLLATAGTPASLAARRDLVELRAHLQVRAGELPPWLKDKDDDGDDADSDDDSDTSGDEEGDGPADDDSSSDSDDKDDSDDDSDSDNGDDKPWEKKSGLQRRANGWPAATPAPSQQPAGGSGMTIHINPPVEAPQQPGEMGSWPQVGWEQRAVAGMAPEQITAAHQVVHELGWQHTPLAAALRDAVGRQQAARPASSTGPVPPGSLALGSQAAAFRARVQAGLRAGR